MAFLLNNKFVVAHESYERMWWTSNHFYERAYLGQKNKSRQKNCYGRSNLKSQTLSNDFAQTASVYFECVLIYKNISFIYLLAKDRIVKRYEIFFTSGFVGQNHFLPPFRSLKRSTCFQTWAIKWNQLKIYCISCHHHRWRNYGGRMGLGPPLLNFKFCLNKFK